MRKERVAGLGVRYQTVLLPPPTGGIAPLPAVRVSERGPGAKPWFLFTTVAVSSVEDALQAWYAFRWRIVRSGRQIEETGHHVAARPERAIDAVIAWRIMTLLAREAPASLAEPLLSDLELLAIRDYATKPPRPPKTNSRSGSHGRLPQARPAARSSLAVLPRLSGVLGGNQEIGATAPPAQFRTGYAMTGRARLALNSRCMDGHGE